MRTPSSTILSFAIGCLLLVASIGCGPPIGPTSGIVRFDAGEPVRSGSIEFRRLSDKERFASRISPEGEFQPANQAGEIGLPPGSYEVVVVQIVLTEDLAKSVHAHGNTVPRRYADYYTSGLSVEVAEAQTEPIELILETDDAS
ncbi:hypothetical protein EC9_32960 [Rosistilla ulvae]|uniref:Carboxypeptidase regulatory-like domain-containing protein n=1 Tax=Rosistilla ulvae TaxID=1930277 RepID=A0A517M2M2_9BACT|nr:carboxypeptidase regulatory-like domain-containing protein [Rosistilla ulvae]QDS89099.1 hypothetical protein EC9_32960 [Rosistilla ulvae]